MAYAPTTKNLFTGATLEDTDNPIPVYAGKKDPGFNVKGLADDEESALRIQIKQLAEWINKKNAVGNLGDLYTNQMSHILDTAAIFKAAAQEKNYSGTPNQPGASELGVQPIIRGVVPDSAQINFSQTVTAGDEAYVWGGPTATDYGSSLDPSVGAGNMILVLKDGIIQQQGEPVTRQFKFRSDELQESPWATQPTVIESLDPDRPNLYQYNTPGAFLLHWDIGTNLAFMPFRDEDPVNMSLLGVMFYEKDYYEDLMAP